MPTWDEILIELGSIQNPFDTIRRKYLKQYSELVERNVIVYYSGYLQKSELAAKGARFDIFDGDLNGFMTTINGLDKTKGLDLFLHTPGGDIAATEAIVSYLRKVFGNNIRAVIPQLAMSAGTMISLSCSEIFMGKHSHLGPIDPQIMGQPTHGILEAFEQARREIQADHRNHLLWHPILSKYNPSLIGECIKAITWANTLVKDWLVSNMFSSEKNPDNLADSLINELASHALTLSHSRHIDSAKLKSLRVKVIDIEANQGIQDAILSVHHACIITLTQTPAIKLIENQNGKAYIQSYKG